MTQPCLDLRDQRRYNVFSLATRVLAGELESIVTRLRWERRYHAVRKYDLRGDNRLHYGQIPFTHKYDRVFFLALLIDEYNLRMSMQEQDRVERKLKSLYPSLESADLDSEKLLQDVDQAGVDYSELSPLLRDSSSCKQSEPKNIQFPMFQNTVHPRVTKSHKKGIEVLKHKLDDIKYQHSHLSHKLYEVETMLPNLVKQDYESIRKDPRWYMRKELVKDCADRGGCCGRGCGCCALRAQGSYTKGVGHCTVECICCVGFRGFRPSPEEKRYILKGMTMILKCDIPTHFLRMVNAYFSKP